MRAPRIERGLSVEQHRVIRRLLALIPVCVWLVYVWPVFFTQLPDPSHPERGHYIRDFLHFYTQGMVVREHDRAALYDIDALAATAERAAPEIPKQLYPPVYGPQVGFLFAPLSAVPYVTALYVWLFITILGYGACVYAIWREDRTLRREALTVVILALGAPGLHFALSFGQVSLIGLACFTAMWISLRRGHLFTAGLALGALAYKPPLAIVAAVVFVVRREWRVVAGAMAAVLVQALVAALYWGPGVFLDYGHALLRLPDYIAAMEPHPELAQTIRSMFTTFGLTPRATLAATLASSLAIVSATVWAWRRDESIDVAFIALGSATLLIDPHFYAYDLLVLTPALMLALAQSIGRGQWSLGWTALGVYAAPIVSMLGIWPQVPWTILALAIFLLAAILVQREAERGQPQSIEISKSTHRTT